MATRADITPELLRQLLSYEPRTGKMFWLPRIKSCLITQKTASAFNTRCAGNEAFVHYCAGYAYSSILNIPSWRRSRVAWAIHYGEWPVGQIDHINGVRDDDRICNLRDVSHKQNGYNQGLKKNNRSGVTGVRAKYGKWRAEIMVDGKSKYLGSFKEIEGAIEARKNAEIKYGFHPNHGKIRQKIPVALREASKAKGIL
jgi:hypothetical protein